MLKVDVLSAFFGAYDRETEVYTFSIPNQEVRIGYTQGLLPTYIGLNSTDVQMGFAVI